MIISINKQPAPIVMTAERTQRLSIFRVEHYFDEINEVGSLE
jgi:hypothetical protein